MFIQLPTSRESLQNVEEVHFSVKESIEDDIEVVIGVLIGL